MISHDLQNKPVAAEASGCWLPTRVEISWDVAGEGFVNAPEATRHAIFGEGECAGIVRVVAAIEMRVGQAVGVRMRVDRGEESRRVSHEVARIASCTLTRDAAAGLVHLDAAEAQATVSITLRACRDGVSLIFARSSVFEMLGVPGGRVEPPTLRAGE